MPQTFPALLTGDQLQWTPPRPMAFPKDQPMRVNVTFVDDPATGLSPGEKMSAVLEQLSQLTPFKDIDDPVAWQRDLRPDRSLPGRE